MYFGSSSLEIRDTPWDARVLGFPTNEVIQVKDSGDPEELRELLEIFESTCARKQVGLSVTRLAASRHLARLAFEEAGFRPVETSLGILRKGRCAIPPFIPEELLEKIEIRPACEEDLNALKGIAAVDFHFGRFFEDPRMPVSVARARNSNWISDLAREGPVDVGIANGSIIGFMAYSKASANVDLLLGGITERYAHLAIPFWIKELSRIQEEAAVTIKTIVSAANIGIMNLYCSLGFRFTEAYIGYHLHRQLR